MLSTLSIAVVFGITWVLSYFMLINNDDIRIIFSYIFCLFNTTQVWYSLLKIVDHEAVGIIFPWTKVFLLLFFKNALKVIA
jgi:hypothetical protein